MPEWSKFLTREQLKALLEKARTEGSSRDYYLLALLWYFGLRSSEVVVLRREHFDMERCELNVPTVKKRKTKHAWLADGATGRPLLPVPFLGGPVQQRVVESLLEWGRGREWLFPGRKVGPMTTRAVRSIFARWARAAGLSDRFHPHSLRHTAGSMLYELTEDVLLVRDFLRHSSVTVTDTYLHRMSTPKARGALVL